MAQLVADADPDIVVVELGTNNCTTDCPNLAAVIDRLMRSVPRTSRCSGSTSRINRATRRTRSP